MSLNSLFQILFYQPEIDLPLAALRLLLAVIFGGIIGWERGKHHQAAGFRTHIIIALASCLLMEMGIIMTSATHSDPTRIAAQVVSGIGFLGAGAIFRFGFDVKGLTTAAGLWAVAAVGLALGTGMYLLAAVVVGLILFVLHILEPVSRKISTPSAFYTLCITGPKIQERTQDIRALCLKLQLTMEKISLHYKKEGDCTLSAHLIGPVNLDQAMIIRELASIAEVNSIELEAL